MWSLISGGIDGVCFHIKDDSVSDFRTMKGRASA